MGSFSLWEPISREPTYVASFTSCECASFQPKVTVQMATVPSVLQPRLNCPPPAEPLPPPVGRDWYTQSMASDGVARLQVAVSWLKPGQPEPIQEPAQQPPPTPSAAEPHPTLKVAEPKPMPKPEPSPMQKPAEPVQEPASKPAPKEVEVSLPKPAAEDPEDASSSSDPSIEPAAKKVPKKPAADDSEDPAIGPLKSITDVYVHDKGRLPHQDSKDGKYAWIRKSSQDSFREARKLAAELTRILACTDGGPVLGWIFWRV